jgi:CRISPR-associated protein Csd1
MILQALNDYYERLVGEEDSAIPLRGFSRQPVPFALEIDASGTLRQVLDLRDESKKRAAAQLVLPEPLKTPGSGFSANFLWDNTGYVLGADAKDKPDRARMSFQAFRERLEEVGGTLDDEGFAAVVAFLDGWASEKAPELDYWKDMAGRNLVFRLAGEKRFMHERPSVREAWQKYYETTASESIGQCLVTGESASIARIHSSIKGVWGAQPSGAAIVSFNKPAFESYGKNDLQGLNAPVSEAVAFNYTTALNDLLKSGSRQRVQIGDASTVFWTERKTESEGFLGLVFSQKEDQGELNDLRLFLEAARDGKMPVKFENEAEVRFYMLGLSPNAARISVRFWHVDTVDGMWRKIGQHFDDLRMVKTYENDPDFPPMWLLLKATAKREDLDNLSPLLAGAFMRAILAGSVYPGGLLAAVIGRIRAEQTINYARAALIKACLVRNARLAGQTSEVTVSLDESSTNTAYRLGRLFAVLEKLQQEAIPGANSTIKDRYYGSASATPRSVFPVLLRLAQHHCAKAEKGHFSDRRIAEILDGLEAFPAHLSLEDQGMFALGYYHQRTSLWTKRTPAAETNSTREEKS